VKGKADALTMVAAVMAGSLAWWLTLSAGVARVRHKLDTTWLARINLYAGLLLIGFGAVLIGELVWKL
jgi:hypothetical protein